MSRGLGSSSTCTVAGIMGAAALTGRIVGRAEAVSIATQMEGHPDNVAPAIMGSLVCSFTPEGALPHCIRYDVNPHLKFITIIPPYEVKTESARKIDPERSFPFHRRLADGPHHQALRAGSKAAMSS